MKTAIALTIAATAVLMPGGAWAENSNCANQYELYGMLMRGAMLCNTPDRPAISKTIAVIKFECTNPFTAKARADPFLAKGMADFDREVKKQSLRQVCTGIDKFMSGIEAGAHIERRQE